MTGAETLPAESSPNGSNADSTPAPRVDERVYFYSARDNAFYLSDELPFYETAGTLPDDLVAVEETAFQVFALMVPPVGKMRAPAQSGLPCWVDEPPLPDEIVSARNIDRKDALLRYAAEQIAPLQDAVDLGLATEEEVDRLRSWKTYRVALNRLEEQDGYPLAVDWPEQPA